MSVLPPLLGIHHVNVTVGDMTAAREFYIDRLGLTERTDRPDFPFDGAWIDVGGQQIHLVVGSPRTPDRDHFAMIVGDLDAWCETLRSHGLEVSEPRGVGSARQSFLRDPFGNLIELQQI
jgi:glyoxylase I family protein